MHQKPDMHAAHIYVDYLPRSLGNRSSCSNSSDGSTSNYRKMPHRGCLCFCDLTKRFSLGLRACLHLIQKESGYLGVAVGERGAANPLVPCGWGCGKLVATGHHKAEHEQECAHREVGRGLHSDCSLLPSQH